MKSIVRKFAALSALVVVLFATGCGGAVERKARYMQRGQEFFAAQNYDKARVEFSNALQIDPKNAAARYQLGQIAERQGKIRDALGNYQAAVEADPADIPARAALARIYLLGGLPDKASEVLAPGLEKSPGDPKLLTVRGAVRAQAGDDIGATADAEAAYKVDPTHDFAVALLSSLYRKAGRSEDAIRVVAGSISKLPGNVDLRVILAELQMQAGNGDAARKLLDEVVALEPARLVHRQRLASFHLMNKDPAAAEAAMREAVSATPDNVEMKLALVQLLGSQVGASRAEQQMLAFVKAEPKNTELRLALGRLHEMQGNNDKARAVYEQLVTDEGVKPDGLVARDRLAALALQRNDIPGASKLIDEVLAENPRDNEALVLRSNLALARGDSSAAITDLRAVLRDQPNAIPVLRALARAHLQNGEAALAEEALRNAMQINPRDVPVRLDLASLLAQTTRTAEARPLIEQVIVDAPTDLVAREAHFRMLLVQSDDVAALKVAEEVSRLRPDLPLGAMLAGQLHEKQGKAAAAQADYEAALKRQPDSAEALSALVRTDIQQKQSARALSRLAAAIGKWPANALLRQLQAEVHLVDGDVAAAVAAFDAAIERSPTWAKPYQGKALAQLSQKRVDDAVAVLQAGVDRTGAYELVSLQAGTLLQAGRTDDAIKVYEAALARNPKLLNVANNLAMLLATHRSDKASLDRAEQLAGSLASVDDAAYVDTRGWVKYKRAEYSAAVNLLQQAVDKAPAAAELRFHLGMALLRSGDTATAREHLEAALKSGRRFEGVDDARAALKGLAATG